MEWMLIHDRARTRQRAFCGSALRVVPQRPARHRAPLDQTTSLLLRSARRLAGRCGATRSMRRLQTGSQVQAHAGHE